MSDEQEPEPQAAYQIKVQGQLGDKWSEWFGGMAITQETMRNGVSVTTMTGAAVDQPALHGILSKIGSLNLTLISVSRIEPDSSQ